MPMLALLLLYAAVLGGDETLPVAHVQMRLGQDSVLCWERDTAQRTRSLGLWRQTDGGWQLQHRLRVSSARMLSSSQ